MRETIHFQCTECNRINYNSTKDKKQKPERLELIQNADAIIWDEALANHRECLEAVMREFDNFRGKVLILMFDAKQLLPVVPGGDHLDIVKASLFSSPHCTGLSSRDICLSKTCDYSTLLTHLSRGYKLHMT